MAEYNPPDKFKNKKRSKTAYNIFFSAHVCRLKQTNEGVPSDRGGVAKVVGEAWKVSCRLLIRLVVVHFFHLF